ncbi:endoplasmic reticulum-Golgi intermediate compartment protein 3-like [Macadamia integrifolia]|uniref:endoplasmic reticulum-Golgi intermediate compartment protein 3-like n=1 Tax=Macadamia integrifolia TaxID=60698 RepID=UPI001C5275F3|nr:endoplasmic reticulum-Golgi intermediate compartment protein 3-like [Macadamia integrifolia]
MGVKQVLKSIDAFPRAEEHLLQKTQSGAVVSIVGLIIMATLFLHELKYYLTTYTVHQMSVDLKRGETLPIHLNVSFPSLPCDVLSIDAVDMSGKHEVDIDTNIWKLRLNRDGHIIGTEYLSDLVEGGYTHKHGNAVVFPSSILLLGRILWFVATYVAPLSLVHGNLYSYCNFTSGSQRPMLHFLFVFFVKITTCLPGEWAYDVDDDAMIF